MMSNGLSGSLARSRGTLNTLEDYTLSERATQAVDAPAYWHGAGDAKSIGYALASTAAKEYNVAFLEAQRKIPPVLRADKDNPFTKSRFLSLGMLLAAVRPVLHECGFSLKQFTGTFRGHGSETKRWYSLPVCSMFTHVNSGQFEMTVIELPVEANKVYSLASAITLAKRYGVQSYLGIATVDDDGAATIQNRIESAQNEEAAEFIIKKLHKIDALDELPKWVEENTDSISLLDESNVSRIRVEYEARKNILKSKEQEEQTAPKKEKKNAGK
jgi:hypothetical protein